MSESERWARLMAMKAELEALGCEVTITINIELPPELPAYEKEVDDHEAR